MNLRTLAEADNAIILEDNVNGWGHAITITDLEGHIYPVFGKAVRVGVDIDPETGLLVAGNKSAVTVRLSRFPINALPDNGWMVETTDITGAAVRGKAHHVMLDRTAGRATIIFGM